MAEKVEKIQKKNPVPIGVIGAGNISDQYLTNIASFPDIDVVAIGDAVPEVAEAQAEKYGIETFGEASDVLGRDDVELVINLTTPESHVPVSLDIIGAGKHVWSEKPIGMDREEARRMLDAAKAAGVRVGVAPDTVLGPGVQTAKRMIADGAIGKPLFATTQMQWQGPELFHPNPAFLYAKGAGPLLDMGPYYVSTLLHMLGPITSVAAVGLKGKEKRVVQEGPQAGTEFPVEVPSTVMALMSFEEGGSAESLYSTDSPLLRHGVVELHGTEGTLVLPDPNTFGGDIQVIKPLERMFIPPEPTVQEVRDVEMTGVMSGRGLGALDMLRAAHEGRDHVANGEFGFHVLDVLLAIEESVELGQFVRVESNPGPIGTVSEDFDPFAATW